MGGLRAKTRNSASGSRVLRGGIIRATSSAASPSSGSGSGGTRAGLVMAAPVGGG
jgi:hypothetical protein